MTAFVLMTPARRITLALGLPAALLAIGWTGLNIVAWTGRGSFPVNFSAPASGRTVSVSVGDGQVRVRPGDGRKVTVSGTVHYSLIRPKVRLESTADGVAIDSHCHFIVVPCSYDYAVTVPAALGADIATGSGDLYAGGLSGPVTLTDGSGNVQATGLSGAAQISDESGDIAATGLSGQRVHLKDESGEVNATALAVPDVTVIDESGDITLTFATVPSNVLITDESGNITVVLPSGSTFYQVRARSSSGSTSVHVPIDSASRHAISASTESGDVTILEG